MATRRPDATTPLRIKAKVHYLIAADLGAFLLGAVFFLLIGRIPLLFSPAAIVGLIAALGFVLGFELLLWLRRGVRAVRVDGDSISLEFGPARPALQIPRMMVREITMSRGLRGRRIIISVRNERRRPRFLEGPLDFIRFGQRITIPAGIFSPKDFSALFHALHLG
jgi:hypothetical protein